MSRFSRSCAPQYRQNAALVRRAEAVFGDLKEESLNARLFFAALQFFASLLDLRELLVKSFPGASDCFFLLFEKLFLVHGLSGVAACAVALRSRQRALGFALKLTHFQIVIALRFLRFKLPFAIAFGALERSLAQALGCLAPDFRGFSKFVARPFDRFRSFAHCLFLLAADRLDIVLAKAGVGDEPRQVRQGDLEISQLLQAELLVFKPLLQIIRSVKAVELQLAEFNDDAVQLCECVKVPK